MDQACCVEDCRLDENIQFSKADFLIFQQTGAEGSWHPQFSSLARVSGLCLAEPTPMVLGLRDFITFCPRGPD